ncbi:Integrator complex subunit 6 [Podila epicladia]|nr:Integrator complex subunit 6 [Podila epicladia]
MIVIFLVDTSASMNQKFSNGMSALECTKSGIEHMVKHLPQVKPADKHNDKFILVTYEDGPGCIKSSFKDPLPHLIKELKVLKAQDMSNPGMSLSTVFDLLSAYRVYHSIDTPGSGRFPGSIEPCVILWFTDGGKQSSPAGVFDRLNIPGITSAGADYFHEPFRWDQRLYTIFLEPNAEVVDPQLSILSNVMGGASYRVRTVRHMLQAMDCMLGISKIPPTQYSPQAVLHIYAIVVNFEDLIVDPRRPNTVNHHQLVYIPPGWLTPQNRHAGFFPIPEPYWPDAEATRLPTRNAQPTVHFHTKEEKGIEIPDGFPYDKYGVAPCPMTQELLTRPPGTCWPPLRNALRRMNINNVMPADQGSLNQVISRQLGKNKLQAKTELDRLLSAEKADVSELLLSKKKALSSNPFDALRSNSIAMLNDLKRPFFKALQASTTTQIAKSGSKNGSSFQSRFGAQRMDMIMDSDDLHSLPIADMGIYQDRMQKLQQENLRDPFRDEESVKSLQRTMFGNPYKQDKKVSIDEEDEASAADSVSTNSSTSGSSWSSILGRRRKPRRRSVSPAHFPVERIPSLSHGDRAVSGKVQTITLGPAGTPGSLPMLRIMVQESFGKSAFTDDESEGLIRPIGMHDGEDEDEEEDDFRRAMFNSDEMEMDVDDEAARLRADTPMPGGIGLDDDDEDMEDLQRAQDNIPPPIIPVSLDDIEDAGMRFPQTDGSVSSMDHMMEEDYDKHRQGIKRDLEHLNGSASPVFESLVYDPNSLMELQSIPKMLPERSQAGLVPLQNGSQPQSLQDVPVLPAGAGLDGSLTSIALSSNLGLTPIPILLPPSESLASNTSVPTSKPTEIFLNDHAKKAPPPGIKEQEDMFTPSTVPPLVKLNGKLPTTSISAVSSPTSQTSSGPIPVQSRLSTILGSESMIRSPSEFRMALVKQLRMPPRSYDEHAVVEMVRKVEGANWSVMEKRRVLVGCRDIAFGLRRVAVASVLDLLEDQLK